MKVIIAGGRLFQNYDALKSFCDNILKNQEVVEIVSGECSGADKLGERYAEERGYKITRFPPPPDWSIGKHAGLIRNIEMATYADALIAFWDGVSKGTGHMISAAKNKNLKIRVYRYELT